MSLESQKISRSLEAAAAEALGGPAARPPQAGIVGPSAPAAVPLAIGHSTFDSTPAAIVARRQAVDTSRARLGGLIRHIIQETGDLDAMIDDLSGNEAVKAEGFDPAAARKFLGELCKVIANLSAKPAKKDAL